MSIELAVLVGQGKYHYKSFVLFELLKGNTHRGSYTSEHYI